MTERTVPVPKIGKKNVSLTLHNISRVFNSNWNVAKSSFKYTLRCLRHMTKFGLSSTIY